jgi:hypothetical protein
VERESNNPIANTKLQLFEGFFALAIIIEVAKAATTTANLSIQYSPSRVDDRMV